MRYIFLFLFLLLSNSFATNTCTDPNIKFVQISDTTQVDAISRYYTYGTSIATLNNFNCSGGSIQEYTYTHTAYNYCYFTVRTINYTAVTSCPSPKVPDSNGICQDPPPPASCPWATTPPYYNTNQDQLHCNNAFPTGNILDPSYSWNQSWCSADSTCYGRKYWCPAGQYFDPNIAGCREPKPSTRNCTAGFYKVCGSVTLGGIKSCFCDYICKTNPKDRTRYEVSCGAGPVDNQPLTNPDAPTEVPPDNPDQKPTNTQNTGNCFASESVARINCTPPNVLSFQCDPLTGTVTKNECKAPTVPTDTPKNTGDDTKAVTTEDIKDLGNKLPKSIKDALSDFFTDGSMPHLEAIRGSLQAALLLDSDRNDKLDAISASADAGLVLQSDANDKLDGIKTSTDGIKSSVDSVNDTLNQGGTFTGDSMPTPADLEPDTTFSDSLSTFTDSFDQTKLQFDTALNVFNGGVPNINFGSGSCPSYQFYGHSVSLSKVGDSIAPYSSIFSIFVYIGLMFMAFRLVFSFFTKGV